MTQSRQKALPSRPHPSIVDVVFGVPKPERRRRILIAILIAAAAHASLLLWAQTSEHSLESWSAEITARVHAELSRDEFVDLAKPPAPPPAEEKPKAEEPVKQPAHPKIHLARRAESSKPPPPAQAGSIIAQDPSPNTPVDLTGETFVTGTANAYAGGVTSPTGTNTVAVMTRDVDPGSPPGARAGEPDNANPVALEDQNWSCPWPREADAEQIDEQTVVIRVVVRADGSVESASVVTDPGHGFSQAATACALQTRFMPAHNRTGEPIRSPSPPIRVRFTR